jgi:CheY-like chemotaxis protein
MHGFARIARWLREIAIAGMRIAPARCGCDLMHFTPSVPGRPYVLLIDTPDQAEMYAIALRHHGYEVLTATGCDDALALARAQRPLVIVLDVRLRDSSGWDTCIALRDDPATAGVPIVVLTASLFEATEQAARDVGAARLLGKPCLPADLARVIDDVIGMARP